MDPEDHNGFKSRTPTPRKLPDDLPRSLDDRRTAPNPLGEETEIYDAWAGQSQYLTPQPLNFNLSLDDPSYGDEKALRSLEDGDSRIVQMMASQARLREDQGSEDLEAIINDEKKSISEKREALQSAFSMAASNGDAARIRRILENAEDYVDINAPDGDGTPPLIYASCFGHEATVSAILESRADVNVQDRHKWSPLMWAMTNGHKSIAKILLDYGASPDVKSSTGRTALDFVAHDSDIPDYLSERGYTIGNVGVTDDFYNAGLSNDRFEEEMAENELRRRMAMESAINLEVDLGNLGLDEQPESPEELEDSQDFVWDKCLNDQMFVFQENELDRILDIIITDMKPQRSPSQKPVPANILFLSARYAHYHANPELLEKLLIMAMDKIMQVVDRYQWDMTILAFWMSNSTLLLHYLKKDAGLVQSSVEFQLKLAELINDIFIFIIRDAERRMDRFLDAAMLDHETIPGMEDIQFQNEWKLFRSKPKMKMEEPIHKRYRPPSPKRRAQVSPRNITSILSSTLFVLDIYDIHSVITSQILSQLFYWLGAELFNRVINNKKYLARTKAMQIRMNISQLEDWARSNSRQPEHYENGSMTSTGETTLEASRRHLAHIVQLLQWLQVFSSLGETIPAVEKTANSLPLLTPLQLIHAVKNYRYEVGETTLPKPTIKSLMKLQTDWAERKTQRRRNAGTSPQPQSSPSNNSPATPSKDNQDLRASQSHENVRRGEDMYYEEETPDDLLLDPSLMLPFSLPTSTDMLVSYGAGFGGLNRERERKYIPTVPPEFLTKLDLSGTKTSGVNYGNSQWNDD
ncbi:ankyrin [Patellaria atrata CBS 101060]|uniref:Ankyrin n=1 Tax=Patellaria atrata CBS 101060 TaxID=1346257 RepID=A0A9P4S3T4_9PEZI|nr:ankyrin [Patellaria atrata CBS 101060]